MQPSFSRALWLLEQGRYAMAEAVLQDILVQSPENAIAYSTLSLCQGQQGNYQAALASAQQGVALAPESAFAYYRLAFAYRWLGQYEAMRDAVRVTKSIAPDDADADALDALYWAKKGRYEQMLKRAEEGLQHDPLHIECQLLRIQALIELNRLSVALSGVKHLLQQAPENPLAYAARGWIRLRLNQLKTALADFREALRLNPECDWAKRGLRIALKMDNPLNILHYVNPYGRVLFSQRQVQSGYWLTAAPLILLAAVSGALVSQNLLVLVWVAAIFMMLCSISLCFHVRTVTERGMLMLSSLLFGSAAGFASAATGNPNRWWVSGGLTMLAICCFRRWADMTAWSKANCVLNGSVGALGVGCLVDALTLGSAAQDKLEIMGRLLTGVALALFCLFELMQLKDPARWAE